MLTQAEFGGGGRKGPWIWSLRVPSFLLPGLSAVKKISSNFLEQVFIRLHGVTFQKTVSSTSSCSNIDVSYLPVGVLQQ